MIFRLPGPSQGVPREAAGRARPDTFRLTRGPAPVYHSQGMKAMTMRIIEIVTLAAIMMPAAFAPAAGQKPEDPGAFFSELVSKDGPGIAVLVVKDGRKVFEFCRGAADMRTGRPISAATNFRLASVTKQFTAAAVMLLVRDGRLSYDDRLGRFFPGFPDYGKDITVRELLRHTSGLPDYEDLMAPAPAGRPMEEIQIKDAGVLELLMHAGAGKFEPGTKWAYSNSGYVLLGLIVEKVSGLPFPSFMRERIFAPLGMNRTVVYIKGLNEVPERAVGHTREDGRWRENDESPTSATLGEGRVYSSLHDLAEWDAALRGHKLFTAAEMAPALEPVVLPDGGSVEYEGAPHAYGFGWFLDPWEGRPRNWHSGDTAGFRTAIQRFTDDGVTAIVLSNRDDLDAPGLALRAAAPYLRK